MAKTKVVGFRDEEGRKRQSILPIDAPDTDAPIGLPLALLFPSEWEPLREKLEEALAARGIVSPDDLFKPGADNALREAIWSVTRLDIATIKQMNQKK